MYIMYADVIWHLKINMFLRQSIWSTNKILKEIAVLECKNAESFSDRSLAYTYAFSTLVFCRYTVVYI